MRIQQAHEGHFYLRQTPIAKRLKNCTISLGESGRQARRGQYASPSDSILNTTERPHPAATRPTSPRRGEVNLDNLYDKGNLATARPHGGEWTQWTGFLIPRKEKRCRTEPARCLPGCLDKVAPNGHEGSNASVLVLARKTTTQHSSAAPFSSRFANAQNDPCDEKTSYFPFVPYLS